MKNQKVISILSLILILVTICTTALPVSANATSTSNSQITTFSIGQYKIAVKEGLIIRENASTKHKKLGAIPYNTVVNVTAIKNNNWGYVKYGKISGYIFLEYTNPVIATNKTFQIGEYKISEKAGVNIRVKPGTNYKKIGAIPYNTIVKVTSVKNNWGYVTYKKANVSGWVCLDYAKIITPSTAKTSSSVSSSGITSSAYKKTGVVYTINGTKYYQAKTTRAYNGVAKDSVFFTDTKGAIVNNATVLNKLYTLDLFNDIRSNQQSAAKLWTIAAKDYYDVCTTVAKNEKMGSLIGKTSGVLLSIGAGNSFGIQEAALEVGGEVCSPETVKTAVLLGMLRVYTNNVVAYGNKAANSMKNPITDYETMIEAANLYAECAANFSAVDYLGGDVVKEMANSSFGKELTKYFKNVFVGFADSIIPDIKSVQITKYVSDGIIALGDFAVNSGAKSVYDKELSKQKKYLSSTYSYAKTMADKLSKTDWDLLVGTTVANIKNGKTYTKYYSASNNISAKAGYEGHCTWYCYGRMLEKNGIALKYANNAKRWLNDNANDPRVKILKGASKITENSIAVNTNGKYGHVMFIEHVTFSNGNPQYVYFSECNFDGNGTYNAGKDCILQKMSYSKFISQRNPAGYIVAK